MREILAIATIMMSVALLSSAVQANQDDGNVRYQADVVIFRTTKDSSGELWRKEPLNAAPSPSQYKDYGLNDPAVKGNALQQEMAALENRAGYDVLLTRSWSFVLDDSRRERIYLKVPNQPNMTLQGIIDVNNNRNTLQAKVDLSLRRVLDRVVETVSPPSTDANPSLNLADYRTQNDRLAVTQEAEVFHLNQRRRIKNTKVIQYFDSPALGVLLKLTKVDE